MARRRRGRDQNAMQPTGDAAFALILLISEATGMVQHYRDECERLARRSKMIGACLQQLQGLELMQNPEIRKLIKVLEDTLYEIYMLVKSCQDTSVTYHFIGGKQSDQFREMQGKINFYLNAFPNISHIYMAVHSGLIRGGVHLPHLQEQRPPFILLSGSPQRMEQGPPPSISTAAITFVLSKAFTYLEGYGIDEVMEAVKERLLMRLGEIEAVLDAIDYLEIKEKSAALCTWMWPLRDAIEETEDAVDGIEYYKLEEAVRAQKVPHKVHNPISKVVKGKGNRNAKVAKISMLRLRKAILGLDEVATDAYLFLNTISLGGPRCYHDTRCTSENILGSIDNLVIGREMEKERVFSWLTQPEAVNSHHDVSIFAILGKGGMGKTTLARLVCKEEEVMESFDSIVWLHFPTNFDAEIMTRSILESVTNGRFSYDTLETLQKILINELSTKKFLLILDDVWEGDRSDEWDKLLVPLKYGQRGSRLVLTTRNVSVVNIVAKSTGVQPELLHLHGLGYNDSLMLFRRYAFAGLDPEIYSALSPGLSEQSISLVVQKSVDMFGGCPLLTKVLGGLLGDNTLPHRPDDIIRLMDNELSGDTIHLLKLCYHGLPAHLQACFRYCSIFPQEHKFKKEELVKLWMGSGLIPEIADAKPRPEDIGQVYLDTLIRKSFLDTIAGGNFCTEDRKEYCVVPSLMHDLAQYFSSSECARVDGGGIEHVKESVRHMYIEQCGCLSAEEMKVISRLKYLRTLVIEADFWDQKDQNAKLVLGEVIKGLKCLRLLSLSVSFPSKFLDEVSSSIHLRYISLFSCGRSHFCKIFKLYHLRVFKLSYSAAKETDLENISNLHHLRYLHVPDNILAMIIRIGRLTSLQELNGFEVVKREGCRLSALKNLVNLRQLCLKGMQNVASYEEAVEFRLDEKGHIKYLSLLWSNYSSSLEKIDDRIINNLQPPKGLQQLRISGYNGCGFPTWMVNKSLNLVSLELKDCTKWESLPSLEMLYLLKNLRLEHRSQLKHIGDEFEEQIEVNESWGACLPRFLDTLTVELCPKLKRLPKIPLSLSQLRIERVGLEVLPETGLSYVSSQLHASSSSSIQSKLAYLHVESCSHLTSLNEGLLRQQEHLPSLQELVIRHCHNIQHLPSNGFVALVQLRYLEIVACPMLRSETEDGLFPMSLKYFHVSSCGDAEVPMLMSLPSLIALRRLSLFNCDNLMNLPSEEVLKTLGVLHDISIARCRNLLSLGGLGAVGSLRVLTIMCCNNLEEVSNTPESLLVHDKSIKNMVDCSFELDMLKIDRQSLLLVEPLMNLKSTKELHICNGNGMTSLPKNWLLNNRASLRSIVIGAAKSLLSLPSWMMELDRLRILHIERASLIKSIPNMPMSLRKLTIWGCHPLLLECCQKDVGPDWPKIANIDADLKAFSRGTMYGDYQSQELDDYCTRRRKTVEWLKMVRSGELAAEASIEEKLLKFCCVIKQCELMLGGRLLYPKAYLSLAG